MTAAIDTILKQLQAKLSSMPPVQSMAFAVDEFHEDRLSLRAPLAANVNDKGCAFGGSLAGLLTLSAWALVNVKLEAAGAAESEVYVQDSALKYLLPLYSELRAVAWLAPEQSWDSFLRAYRTKGRARATLYAQAALPDGRPATTFHGRFVAIAPDVRG